MTDLATWLLEQIEEDRQVAAGCRSSDWRSVGYGYVVDSDVDGWKSTADESRVLHEYEDDAGFGAAVHAAHFDPGRVLAECEAKRRIVEMFPVSEPEVDELGNFIGFESNDCGEHRTTGGRAWCFMCQEWCYPTIPCARCHGVHDVLKLLALPYQDRPGYDETWRPA